MESCSGLRRFARKFFTLESTQSPLWIAQVSQFIEDRLVPYAAYMHEVQSFGDRANYLREYIAVSPLLHL